MNKEILKGNWMELKGKVKEQWGKITDDKLTEINGDYDQLAGLLQEQYGYNKENAENLLNNFLDKCQNEKCEK